MKTRALWVLLMLVVPTMAALPPTAATSFGPAHGVQATNWNVVTFVDNSVVDLVWDPWGPDLGYKVLRDGHLIAELGVEVTYYRDLNVPPGPHTYQLYRVQEGGDLPSYSDTVTMGLVQGVLYQDLAWTQGTYTLATVPAYPPGFGSGTSAVYVMDGVTLHIGPGVTVVGEVEWYGFEGPGALQIDGATLDIDWLALQNPSSYLENSTATLRSMFIQVDGTLDSNIIQVTEDLYIQDQAQVVLTNNTFYGTSIRVQDQAHVTLDNNTLGYYHDSLDSFWLESSSNGGSLTNNTFVGCAQRGGWRGGSITVATTAPVEIRGNYFRCLYSLEDGAGISVRAVNPGVIEENVFEGPSPFGDNLEPSTAQGVRGITLGSGAAMTIRNNIFYNFPGAIVIDQANHPEIENNRMQANYVALYLYGDIVGTIRNNCIGAEAGGIIQGYTPNGTTLNVEGNWWGDPTGPLHQSNLEGKGAWIRGNYVDFDPWITDPNDVECGITDLRIAGLEVVQVVQAVNNSVPLVENKPTVVRVYPDISYGRESNVGLELTASRDGAILGTITPWRPPSIVQPVHNINQARADERRGASSSCRRIGGVAP